MTHQQQKRRRRQQQQHLSLYLLSLSLSLFLLLLSSHIPTCDGFASMFVENKSSCWIELRDTKTEVIMNNLIVSVHDSSHGENDVRIKVLDELTMESPHGLVLKDADGGGSGKTVVYIAKPESNDNDGSEASFRLILEVDESAELYDLQYVMDAKVYPELDENQMDAYGNALEEEAASRMKAQFTSRKSGCEKSRSFGKKGDAGVVLDIQIPLSVYNLGNDVEKLQASYVDVVAGWACGHEAVTLTHSIEFRPLVPEALLDGGDEEGKSEEEEIVSEKIAEEMPGVLDVPIQAEEELEVIREEQEGEKRQRNMRGRHNDHDVKEPGMILHKFNRMYQKSSFGQAAFTNFGYFKGIAIIVSFGAILWKVYLSKQKKSKGRREL